MARAYPVLCLALTLIAATAAGYAWHLHGQLAALQSTRPVPAPAATRPASPAPISSSADAAPVPAATPAPSAPAPERAAPAAPAPGAPGRNRGGDMAAFMETPEMQRLMGIQQRAALDGRFAALFRKLGLSPADLEKFKNLLVDKQTTARDVYSAARAQGMNGRENRDDLRSLVEASEAEIDTTIRTTFGESAYQQYKQFEQTMPQRGVVSQVEQRLSYSATPLTSLQSEQLVSLLAASTPGQGAERPVSGPGGMAFAPFGTGRGGVGITNEVIAGSQGFLAAPQIDALRQIQAEQAAAAEVRRQIQEQNRSTPRNAPPGKGSP